MSARQANGKSHAANAEAPGMVLTAEQIARFAGGDMARGRREIRSLLSEQRPRKLITGPTERPPTVRLADEQDEEALFEYLKLVWSDNGWMFAPFVEHKVRGYMEAGTRRQGGLIGLFEDHGEIIGSVGLMPVEWWWSTQYFVQDLWLHVREDHRKSPIADDLASFAKWGVDAWSAGFGYPIYLLTGVMSVYRPRAKTRFYRKHFNEIGGLFVYPPPPGMTEG